MNRETEQSLGLQGMIYRAVSAKKNVKIPKAMSIGEATLLQHIRAEKLPMPTLEHQFDTSHKWRADFAWLQQKLIVEVEGGTWSNGRHNRGKGYEADCVKYNAAVKQGWRLLRYTTDMVKRGEAINDLVLLLK